MIHYLTSLPQGKKYWLFFSSALLISIVVTMLFIQTQLMGPVFLLILSVAVIYLTFLFKYPSVGLISIILICFLSGFFSREVIDFPFLTLMEVLLILTLAACLTYSAKTQQLVKNDLVLLLLLWLGLSVLQILNPAQASIEGALGELRTLAVYPFLFTLITFMIIKTNEDLNRILILFLVLSLIACLNGIKQQHLGLTVAEQAFLDNGGALTHVLWGKLRIFSFYDAARFGCLMAQFAVISAVLVFSKYALWKRVLLLILSGLFIYGMLISGTRTALIVIITGGFYALLASRNFKALFFGGIFMLLFLSFLKFTHIGNGSYEIYRLRSAVNPEDASLNVRFTSQQKLSHYMAERPFGAGLGVIGYYGHKYNSDQFPSTVEPDSFWVKIWVMYGVVGMILWFGMYMYIFGKCFGIIWKINDPGLRFKLNALASSSFGIFFCSYGNEIINVTPSLLIVAVSLVIVYQGPRIDQQIQVKQAANNSKLCP